MAARQSKLAFAAVATLLLAAVFGFVLRAAGAEPSPDDATRLETAQQQMQRAMTLYRQGKPREAIPLARDAADIYLEVLGQQDRTYLIALNNLGELHHAAGDYARAVPLLRRVAELARETLGPGHPDYAVHLSNLAGLYQSLGDSRRAEELLGEVLQIRRAALGPKHPDYAAAVNNLAGVYYTQEKYGRAEELLREAVALRAEILGKKHPDYAVTLNNLAAVYEATEDYARAEDLYREARQIRKEVFGEKHPRYADSLNNLAALFRAKGDYDAAEPLYRQALDIRREALGRQHPDYAVGLNNLAALYRTMGRFEKAEPLYRESLDRLHRLLHETFAVLSQRQQLAMVGTMRRTLDGYLSVTAAGGPRDASYRYALAWKGLVFLRQREARLAAARPELAPLLEALQATSARLAALALSAEPLDGAAREELARVSQQKGSLEAELAQRSAEFRGSREPLSPQQLAKALPEDVVLIDFLEYIRSLPAAESDDKAVASQRRLAAFVVRRDRPAIRLELGPAEPIGRAIDVWRRSYGRPGPGAAAGDELRRRVWLPLAAHLDGAKTVLISPDGALTRFPLAALPGKKPGTYLIEELAVAVVPVPQALPALLERKPRQGATGDRAEASLLVLGDVDYDTPLGPAPSGDATHRSPPEHTRGLRFERLQNSRGEMLAVRDSFETAFEQGAVRMLRSRQATESAFRREAARHRFLHLTTHGFFGPRPLRSLLGSPAGEAERDGPGPAATAEGHLAAFHPGLLSGLALAGANTPHRDGDDDGILTAEEVATMQLGGVELAVLSACETGLGPVAGGEGVLGLQRAFQVAGAQTVVASLWKVGDESTRVLMERFYENLWDKKLGTLEALRQAQLKMLDEPAQRGIALVPTDPEPQPTRRPPYDWAAFVLSGDWR